MCPVGDWSLFPHIPRCLPHPSIPVSVFSTDTVYVWCQLQIKGDDEKSLYFVKCCNGPNFSDIIDYTIQVILKNKNRTWEFEEKSIMKELIKYMLYIYFCVWKIHYKTGRDCCGQHLACSGRWWKKITPEQPFLLQHFIGDIGFHLWAQFCHCYSVYQNWNFMKRTHNFKHFLKICS